MKTRLVITLLLAIVMGYVFNSVKIGPLAPLGKFFDPFNGFWQNAETSDWQDASMRLAGLHDEVQVFMDDLAIAHIVATNNHDLYFMQGYVTARDRLWQMDFTTRVAAGRLSEVIGEGTLEVDRFFRRMGLARAAQGSLDMFKTHAASWEAVTAYSNGVNAWINSLSYADYPIEYKLMHYAAEPWTPLKCALMAKLMAFNLASTDDDVQMTNALEKYGRDVIDRVFPDFPDGIEPIVEADWKWIRQEETNKKQDARYKIQGVSKLQTPNSKHKRSDHPLKDITGADPNNGSNNWALSGSKTATGKPLLANDTHLNLWMPCTWYIIHLTSPDVNVMGGTLPGAPTVVVGFNDSIAWGVTNAQRDVKDWYRNAPVTRQVIDTIGVWGRRPFYDTVTYTAFGAVVYDESFGHSFADTMRQGLAMKWAAHEPSNELAATLALNRAKNFDDYLEAIEHFSCPGQNFVFVSKSGDIAIKHQGRFPDLRPEQGRFVMDGSDPNSDWQGWIPNDLNPMMKNPERGFVSSANQHPTDSTYPFYYQGNFGFFRHRRINALLAPMEKATHEDMRIMQGDSYSLLAHELLDVVFANLDSAKDRSLDDVLRPLREWDFIFDAESVAAPLFEVFSKVLLELTFDEFFINKRLYPIPDEYALISFLKTDPHDPIFDRLGTSKKETALDIIRLAASNLEQRMTTWAEGNENPLAWGDYREVRLQHATRGIPAFDVVVKASGHRTALNALTSDHGPAWRMVVSLEDDTRAWAIYPGGQSGNPGSRHYDDFVSKWVQGELAELVVVTDDGNPRIIAVQTFTP